MIQQTGTLGMMKRSGSGPDHQAVLVAFQQIQGDITVILIRKGHYGFMDFIVHGIRLLGSCGDQLAPYNFFCGGRTPFVDPQLKLSGKFLDQAPDADGEIGSRRVLVTPIPAFRIHFPCRVCYGCIQIFGSGAGDTDFGILDQKNAVNRFIFLLLS